MDSPELALKAAKDAAGGAQALAQHLSITHQAVAQWKQAPVRKVLAIEELTGIPRHRLRPDIYPKP